MLPSCDRCDGPLDRLGVCTACGRHTPLTARERVDALTPAFDEQDETLAGGDPLRFSGYAAALAQARRDTGLGEAAVWGWASIEDVRCALVVLDFRFLGGSMGVGVGEKVARTFDAAREAALPVVAVTASGGARMQEGMAALVQMAKTVEARRRHARAGLAQVTLLTSPTTGGVYASFASLADVVLAEPLAHVGFGGPRVVRELTGRTPPKGVHTAEFAYQHGAVDAIVARGEQAETIARTLRCVCSVPLTRKPRAVRAATRRHTDLGPWQRVQLARDPARPKARQVLDALLDDAIELRGGEGIVVRAGALETGTRVIAVAQDASVRIMPRGLRAAQRAIGLAGRLGLPLVSVVDTPGADPGPEAERSGVAAAIAQSFVEMLDCPSPTIAVLTGEGGSGGALSLTVADRVLAWEHAFFSVIAPEGAASILFRDGSRAPELAERLRLTADDLVDLGVVDEIVPEPDGGAQADAQLALATLSHAVASAVDALRAAPAPSRIGNRRRRWRRAGSTWLRYV
jgi:acetyl-CoA carboxylase carboxyl transferase subunit beta